MTARKMKVPLSGHGPAMLTLPNPLTPDMVHVLEISLAALLDSLKHELGCGSVQNPGAGWEQDPGYDSAPNSVCKPADAGQLEYASWAPQLRH